jgi:hypothetical protein
MYFVTEAIDSVTGELYCISTAEVEIRSSALRRNPISA